MQKINSRRFQSLRNTFFIFWPSLLFFLILLERRNSVTYLILERFKMHHQNLAYTPILLPRNSIISPDFLCVRSRRRLFLPISKWCQNFTIYKRANNRQTSAKVASWVLNEEELAPRRHSLTLSHLKMNLFMVPQTCTRMSLNFSSPFFCYCCIQGRPFLQQYFEAFFQAFAHKNFIKVICFSTATKGLKSSNIPDSCLLWF